MKVYDHHFNSNEWFIIFGLCVGLLAVYFLPKRFPKKTSIIFFTSGVFSGLFFDHSLSVQPVSYYDVNDNSSYQVMDFLSYITYGPISYLYFYFYDRYQRISPPTYILLWALFSTGLEWISVYAGVFHYNHGYTLYYSFPIYIIVQSAWLILYYRYRKDGARSRIEIQK